MISRRALLSGIAAAAFALGLGIQTVYAATANVTWTTAYTSADFSTPATAFAGIGTDLTASSTGHVTLTSTSGTIVALAVADGSKALVGHPLTIGATTCMIVSQSSNVVTVAATSAYPAGTFGSTPSVGSAYSIADVASTISIGQSGATSNSWASQGHLACNSITTSATDTLTISSATAWAPGSAIGINTGGVTSNPVVLNVSTYGGNGFTSNIDYLTVQNLQFSGTGSNNQTLVYSGGHGRFINDAFYTAGTGTCVYTPVTGTTSAFINCVIGQTGTSSATFGGASGGATVSAYFCTIIGGSSPVTGGYGACAAYSCVFLGQTSMGASGAHQTYSSCLVDQATPPSGCTTIASSGQIINKSYPYDARPLSSGALPGGGTYTASAPVDIYGTSRPSVGSVTAGVDQTALTPPGQTTILWDCGYNGSTLGTIQKISLWGLVSTMSWTGGVVTVTTAAPHGIQSGALFQVAVTQTTNTNNWNSLAIATVTGTSTFTFPLVSDPGALPGGTFTWCAMVLNTYFGIASGAITTSYESFGSVCPSTASGSNQMIVSAAETATCLGHVVQWKSGNYGIITAFSAGTITVGGGPTIFGSAAPPCSLSGSPITISADFGGTPQSGDAYTIYPSNHTFNIGGPSIGSRFWSLAGQGLPPGGGVNNNGACIQMGPATVNTIADLTINGIYAYNKNVPAGYMADNGSALVLKATGGANVDHNGMYSFFCDATVNDQQLWCADTGEADGCIQSGGTYFPNVALNNVLMRDDGATNDQAHSVIGTSVGFNLITMINCGMVVTDTSMSRWILNGSSVVSKFCGLISTCDLIETASTQVSSGTTLYLNDTSTIVAQFGTTAPHIVHPDVSVGAYVSSIPSSGTVVMSGGSITGTITVGATLSFVAGLAADSQTGVFTAESSGFFGAQQVVLSGATAAFSGVYTDSTAPIGATGLTQGVSYPAAVASASGLFATGTVDMRLPPGSPLIGAGTYDAAVPLDIYGQTRPNPPAAWFAEPVPPVASGGAGFFHTLPI